MDLAARVAVRTTWDYLLSTRKPELVRFVLFDQTALAVFTEAAEELDS